MSTAAIIYCAVAVFALGGLVTLSFVEPRERLPWHFLTMFVAAALWLPLLLWFLAYLAWEITKERRRK